MIIIKKVRIKDIRRKLYNAYLDTEYREALAHSMMTLGYVKDTPFNLYFGTPEQREKLENIENKPLDSNEISEIIHLMMYEMRNDFQYGTFKPIATELLEISEKMKKTIEQDKIKSKKISRPRCDIHEAYGSMMEIIGLTSKKLKENNMMDESREMIERATTSYSYDDAFNIINEYVETFDKEKIQEEEEEFEG